MESIVYTCQQPKPKGCDFFLWDDDAKPREAAAVLNNSRTEPNSDPTTPSKPRPNTALPTPQSDERRVAFEDPRTNAQVPAHEVSTPSKARTTSKYPFGPLSYGPHQSQLRLKADSQATAHTNATATTSSDEEFFDWPASDEEELGKAADQASTSSIHYGNAPAQPYVPPPETPRKAQKLDHFSTPSSTKRRFDEMNTEGAALRSYPTPTSARPHTRVSDDRNIYTSNDDDDNDKEDDVFTTPTTTLKPSSTLNRGLSATDQPPPPPPRFNNHPNPSALADEVLGLLPASVPSATVSTIRSTCERHAAYTHGILRGRDVSRETVRAKEERIVQLMGEVEALRTQRDAERGASKVMRR